MNVTTHTHRTIKSRKLYLKIAINCDISVESVVGLLKYRIFVIFGAIGYLKAPFKLVHYTTSHIYLQTLESCLDKLLVALDNHLISLPLLAAENQCNLSFISCGRTLPSLITT
ncbi:hypothetical protein BmR1_04g09918 [Babesia microti strain RI]|uniref:Uncharacterized protein n=1 Tax=Babesia microti (strain RI) TaxID=1133968 RepID=A0A1N6LYI7_BABMR|nr:hypothetical protein BmR1_04g09918 [Babesia microti strain RI]SIO73932.1 hypothetical protein BmR1_04g09918 [Babesia microti strain RI]|eukprot:XP_012650558.2 hypothetical protein BmR1_04g09918 [Babesia microti strain RI]